MGESTLPVLRVDFDRRLKPESHGGDISFDGGLLPYRGLDDTLGLIGLGTPILPQFPQQRGPAPAPCARLQSRLLRTLALPEAVEHGSLTTLRNKLIKIGAKVERHGRYVTFQLAEVAISRALFAEILCLIDRAAAGPFAAMTAAHPVAFRSPDRTGVLPRPGCALTVRKGQGAGLLIAKSARSKADHSLP